MVTRLAVLLDAHKDPDWVIAGICGIHPSALSLYRNNRRAITQKHAVRLAELLEVDVDDIRGEATDEWREQVSASSLSS